MHTYKIATSVLDAYKHKQITQERIDFLKTQANEQLEELAQNKEVYDKFLKKIDTPENIDNIILWMLLMSDEDICDEYIYKYKKNFREIIPVSDLADLLFHLVYLKRVQNTTVDGFDYLLNQETEGIDDMDQYCFTNILLHVQKSKEVEMEF